MFEKKLKFLFGLTILMVAIGCSGKSDGGGGSTSPVSATVGGNIIGLDTVANDEVVLQLNGETDAQHILTVKSNTSFVFPKTFSNGEKYSVLVQSAKGTTCMAYDNTGEIASSNVTNVQVVCNDTVYTLSVDVKGLRTNSTAVFQNNAQDDLTVTKSGKYSFSKKIPAGAKYNVLSKTNPGGTHEQICTPSANNAEMSTDTTVEVICGPQYHLVKGTYTGLNGNGLKIKLNNTGEELTFNNPPPASATVATNFAFTQEIAEGSSYSVSISQNPSNLNQTCTVTNGTGTMPASEVSNVSVACSTNEYTVGGKVTGMSSGDSIVLTLNGGSNKSITKGSTNPTFEWNLNDGQNYVVAVQTHAAGKTCSVSNGSGKVSGANINNVTINCAFNQYTVSGSVAGLCAGQTIKVRNNGAIDSEQSIVGNNNFTFPAQNDLSQYKVTVTDTPDGVSCTVANGTGSLSGGNIVTTSATYPQITCTGCASCNGSKSITVKWEASHAKMVSETGGGHKVYWSTKNFSSPSETGVTEVNITTGNSTVINGLKRGCTIHVRVRPYTHLNPDIYNETSNPLGSKLSDQYSITTSKN